MVIHPRPIAITAAVISFFGLSFIGLFNDLSPSTCCKRAFIGAALVYLASMAAVKIINAILTSAIIDSRTNKRKEAERVG